MHRGMMTPVRVTALALLLIAGLAPALVLAQQSAGVVTLLDGTATRTTTTTATPAPLKAKDDVFIGDRITTAGQSLLKMVLGRNALLTVRELSALTITEQWMITLDNGKLAYVVAGGKMQPGEVHEIRTPNAVVQIRGTFVVVEVRPNSVPAVTNICALAGTVVASALGGAKIQIGPNECITITGAVLGPVRREPT